MFSEKEDLNYVQLFSMNGRPGEVAFNNPRIRDLIDGTDPFHLSHAVVTGRAMVARYLAFFKRYVPGCDRAFVSMTAPMVGVRETRRIVGEYTLTADDFWKARKFDDAIARNCYPIDLHRRKEEDSRLMELPKGEYHEIPVPQPGAGSSRRAARRWPLALGRFRGPGRRPHPEQLPRDGRGGGPGDGDQPASGH